MSDVSAFDDGITPLERQLDILDIVVRAAEPPTLKMISRATGFPMSTCHRHLVALVAAGVLTRDPERRYQIGSRMIPIGLSALRVHSDDLGRLDTPVERLHAATDRQAFVGIVDGRDTVVVEERHSGTVTVRLGDRLQRGMVRRVGGVPAWGGRREILLQRRRDGSWICSLNIGTGESSQVVLGFVECDEQGPGSEHLEQLAQIGADLWRVRSRAARSRAG